MKACSLTATDEDGDGNANFADFLTFAGKFGSRLGQERYDPRCDLIGSPEVWKCEIPTGRGGEAHRGITQNWVDAIRTGSPLLAPGVEGIKGVELANAMLLSAWTDSWVDIPVDADLFYTKLQEQIKNSTSTKNVDASTVLDVSETY